MKEFNITGLCIPSMHYLVDIGEKLEKIQAKIDKGKYFTINRGRQYGKTTTLSQIYQRLNKKYLVLRISFEAIGDAFSTMEEFSTAFIKLVTRELERENVDQKIITTWKEDKEKIDKIDKLSEKITELCKSVEKEVVLLIDEVDKSSNNQLFLYFLGMLRNKYLDMNEYLYSQFITNNRLDMEHLLNKFSEFMYNEHRKADATFIEQNGRLLFLCFLKPIINGAGFYYVEPEIREDKRMDYP